MKLKPHKADGKEAQGRLDGRVHVVLKSISAKERFHLVYGVISKAAEFFAFCPDDFCVQHADWDEGRAVFGGTNRLLWSVQNGFYPDPSYCSTKFLEQFEGETWEKLGELQCDGAEIVMVSSHHLNLDPGEVLPRLRVPLAWAGVRTVFARKSKKGDGKIAEIKFLTGAEA